MTPPSPKPSPVVPLQPRSLKRHPASGATPLLKLSASLVRETLGGVAGWQLCYTLAGDIAALRIPPPRPPGQADGLWRHTCFEAFVALQGKKNYQEFNFSPSGQWAAYAFSDERVRDPAAEAPPQSLPPRIDWSMVPGACTLQAWLPEAAWPRPGTGEALVVGLSAVTETLQGQVHHWALHHPRPQPDFHHRESFAWTLPL